LRDDLALHLHAGAQIVGEVDLEAFELAARTREVPRRVSTLSGDLDGIPLLALCSRAAKREGRTEERQTNDSQGLHRHSPVSRASAEDPSCHL
jgi:hypothetical protein